MARLKVLNSALFAALLVLSAFASSSDAATPDRCIAIRGNGELVPAHWSAMGRLIEEEGLFDGGAGGSSASVTLFLYESMLLNPQLRSCDQGRRLCSESELRLRASLLMKSVFAYLDVVKNADDYQALIGLAQTLAQAKADLSKLQANPVEAGLQQAKLIAALRNVINQPSVRALVNPELIRFVQDAGSGQDFRIQEAINGVKTFGSFDSRDKAILFRPGLLSFETIADRIGRVGNFYAGRGSFYDAAGMQSFLDRCAPLAQGKSWSELVRLQGGPTASGACHFEMAQLMRTYRENLLRAPRSFPSRLEDRVGGQGFHGLVSLASIQDSAAIRALGEEKRAYWAGRGFDRSSPMRIFDQVDFGYLGQTSDLGRALRKDLFNDLKTMKAKALGQATWRQALLRSPSEPGLSAVMDGPLPGTATAAGWTDLAPTLVLKNLGCKRIVYLTRMGQDSTFAQGVETLFGASESQLAALHSLDRRSSLALSIQVADRVYCTNWNNQGQDVLKLELDGYHAGQQWGERKYLGCGGSDSEVR